MVQLKHDRCSYCGGGYKYYILASEYENEGRFVLKCPYCMKSHYKIIEDGILLSEHLANKSLKNLPPKQIEAKAWMELKLKDK
ncbi:MAG: hypothetical protein EAX86_10770 [Candidatus Heimdallarchaeota archaeon]|nr:hypothetical protein [Candidatus Heimdallarchaeota archaeon]